jgi:hypothetical protein
MIRAAAILIGVLVFGSIVYSVYYYRVELGLVRPTNESEPQARQTTATARSQPRPATGSQVTPPQPASWQTIDRPADSFRVALPAGATETRAPAYAARDAVEQVDMLQLSTGPESAFAVSWAQNPPIVRASRKNLERTSDENSNRIQDRILDLALNGALTRTHTALITQSRTTFAGYRARDFDARGDGGVMTARLILAGNRLFLLVASFPSQSAQHDADVNRFFNSFRLTAPAHPN